MPDYHRFFAKGGTYFFTVVTYRRQPFFKEEKAISLLYECIHDTMIILPFEMVAIVILPDHIHTIWNMPDNDFDFSVRWKKIKALFNRKYHSVNKYDISESMLQKGEQGIWQRRFWEHLIRNQEDYNRHLDYIHYNPVKHNLVNTPLEWKHSSFTDFVNKGLYNRDWGQQVPKELKELDFE